MTTRKKIQKKPKPEKKRSPGEMVMAFQLKAYNIPFEQEYQFDEVRKWRLDFALVAIKVGIEIEGGVWTGGRHTRGSGFVADMSKYNAAAKQGWTVLRFTPEQVKKGQAINEINLLFVGKK